jgi:hypothetical protein
MKEAAARPKDAAHLNVLAELKRAMEKTEQTSRE